MNKFTLFLLFISLSFTVSAQLIPAFPGAEGGGMYVTGGRGGKVLVVTSLADDGSTGTLRWAINQSGARIIVFRVAGTITLTSRLSITKGDVTIAGQTAPGDGICLRNYDLYLSADNVIIRYVRVRLGNTIITNESDATWGRYRKNIILDHCSFSWSIDETASYYSNENFTMQWCFITESLNNAGHAKGAHGYGGIWGGNNASFHHNLIAYHNSRNPRFNGYKRSGLDYSNPLSDEILDFRNNVIYGWGDNSSYGGESGKYNIVNNYFKYGPGTKSTVRYKITQIDIDADPSKAPPGYGKYYISGNYVWGSSGNTSNNWSSTAVTYGSTAINTTICKATIPFTTHQVGTHTAEMAFEKVLTYAGCSKKRDLIDIRIANEALTGTSAFKGSVSGRFGIIDKPEDVEGHQTYTYDPAQLLADTDGDGMPDEWENANGLNPSNNTDASLKTLDANYTNIEMYINSLVQATVDSQKEGVIAGVKNSFIPNINVYPNPASGEILHISGDKPVNSVRLFNLNGICVLSQEIYQNSINISTLQKGIYLLQIESSEGIIHQSKFVKM